MRRIDTATAKRDKFGEGKHGFSDGDPIAGTPPTELNAGWFDSVQEEIARVIEAGDEDLNPEDHEQLLRAIGRLIYAGSRNADTLGGHHSSHFAIAADLLNHVNNRNNPHGVSVGQVTGAAPLNSPGFTGNPTAPTPATADSDTSLATTAFVKAVLQSLNFSTGITGSLSGSGGYIVLPIASPIADRLVIQIQRLAPMDFASGEFIDVVFPTAFPRECIGIVGNFTDQNPNGYIGSGNRTQTGARLYFYEYTHTVQLSSPFYIAVGR